MSAVTDAATTLWVAEEAVAQLLALLPAAATEAGASGGVEARVTAWVQVAQKALEKAHTEGQRHLADTGQPVPASGGGNKTDPYKPCSASIPMP